MTTVSMTVGAKEVTGVRAFMKERML